MGANVSDLIISAALGGLVTGIVVPTLGEWLKGYFNGFHANNRRKKRKEKIIGVLRYVQPEITEKGVMIEGIYKEVFKGEQKKKSMNYLLDLLMELHREGRVKKYVIVSNGVEHQYWEYSHAPIEKKVYI